MTMNVAVDDAGAFTSYLFVTQVLGGKPDPISTGVVQGKVLRGNSGLQFSDFELILDSQESIPLEQR